MTRWWWWRSGGRVVRPRWGRRRPWGWRYEWNPGLGDVLVSPLHWHWWRDRAQHVLSAGWRVLMLLGVWAVPEGEFFNAGRWMWPPRPYRWGRWDRGGRRLRPREWWRFIWRGYP